MRKRIGCLGVAGLLLCLLVLCMAPAVYAQNNEPPQVPPDLEETASAQLGDAERIESLTALIVMYSEQLEEYDRSNGSFVVACVGVVGVVLGVAVNLFDIRKEKGERKRPDYGMAALFSLIPGTMALCLYVFSMQCRRVVFFRGYLTYLEGELGKLTGIPMVFNSRVVGKFFGEFATMTAGFGVMAITVIVAFAVSIYCCLYYATRDGQWSNSMLCKLLRALHQKVSGFLTKHLPKKILQFFKKILSWLFCPSTLFGIILLVFGVCCAICVVDLCSNGDIPKDVYDFCLNPSN